MRRNRMLQVVTFAAKVGIRDQTEMESLLSCLRNKVYLPIIRSMFTHMFSLAKLPEPDEELITKIITQVPERRFMRRPELVDVLGDLFITDDIVYVLNPIKAGILQTSAIGYERQEEFLQRFCSDVEEGIKTKFDGRRVRGMEFDWKSSSSRLSRYITHRYSPFEEFYEEPERETMELKASKPNYSSEDVKAADLLVDASIRQFILKLAQAGKMISKDAVNLAKKPDTLQHLLSLGLISEEYLLTCKQDQHTICVVPSKHHLTQEPMASLRCSVCERSFPEENLQVIYTLTDMGKRLVDGSLWMSIWITELLKENGVRKEGIKWGLEAAGEELDIMMEDFDSRLFFELKDREFGLGDAYPFTYRVMRYGGALGIVVTTDKVSTDAKKFFEEEKHRREQLRIQYLEGSENIQKGIVDIVEWLTLSQVHRVIQPFSLRIGFDLWPIVEHWINTKTK